MLKLERCKRALAVVLAVLMVAAAATVGIILLNTDKSKSDVLEIPKFESINLVSTPDGEFVDVATVQNDVNKLTISGKANVAGGFAVRIGTEILHSQIFGVTPDASGEFNATFMLNTTFCNELNNVVPVTICHGNDEFFIGNVGVVTYDYDNGILGYPAGATYLTEAGSVALTTPYVPADAKLDEGKATVSYNGSDIVFAANPTPLVAAPDKGTDGVTDQVGVDIDGDGAIDYIKALLNTTAGREYTVSELDGSVGADYGKLDTWVDAETAKEMLNLVPGHKYSFWVRVPGVAGETLPSAPVLLGSIIAMDANDAAAKNAFLLKYEEIIVTGQKTLYPSEKVTATVSETLTLINLYNALPQYVKDLEDIQAKGKYLVLSNYLAKHQDIIAATKDAITYDALLGEGKFTPAQIERAAQDFAAIKTELKAKHFADATDGAFILEIKKAVEKMSVFEMVPATDPNKDKMCEATDFASKFFYEAVAPNADEAYDHDATSEIAMLASEYNFMLWIKAEIGTNVDENTFKNMTLEDLEAKFKSLGDVETFSMIGDMLREQMFAMDMYEELIVRYDALLDAFDAQGNAKAVAAITNGINKLTDLAAKVGTVDTFTLRLPSAIYDEAITEANYHIALAKAYADIEAMKDGKSNVTAVANRYKSQLNGIGAYSYANASKLQTKIASIVAKAQSETDFEKRTNSAKDELTAEVAALKASGRYTNVGEKQLDSKLGTAKTAIDKISFAAGKTIADIEAAKSAASADFKTVKVRIVTFGTKGQELSGNIVNENGMDGALTVTVTKKNDKLDLEAIKQVIATGQYTKEKEESLTDGKEVLFTVNIGLANVDAQTLKDNGEYIVKVLIPRDYRAETGLQVVTESGDTTYTYDTVRAGAYLVFTVTDLSEEYHVICDKVVNLLWLVILLSVLLLAEIVVIVYLIIKRRKGTRAAVFAPFLALTVAPGISTSIIILGTLSIIGAIAIAALVIDSKKKSMM